MDLRIDRVLQGYRDGSTTPRALIAELRRRMAADAAWCAWIEVLDDDVLAPWLERLDRVALASLPLYGVPFAIKDNIDLAHVATTAACKGFERMPTASAAVVQRLLFAGAIPLGKTNLDQFATGLVGTRSPFGVCRNAVQPAFVSGGSSSGSAVAVARAHVSFSLGTDTAGSGRVPAALNGIVGWKPSRGLLSARGVVPACQSLDCVSVFTTNTADADRVRGVVAGFDPGDPYARAADAMPWRARLGGAAASRIGVAKPAQLQWLGSGAIEGGAERCYALACARMRELGCELVEVDIDCLLQAGQLLYGGPWLAERWLALRDAFAHSPESIHPVLQQILPPGEHISAAAAFAGAHRLAELQQRADALLAQIDALLLPTTGGAFTVEEVLAEPVLRNSELGRYTTFANLLDMAVVSLPAGADALGMPFGVSFMQRAGSDAALLTLAARFAGDAPARVAPSERVLDVDRIELAVCGAHMQGLPLNHELTSRGARFVRAGQTAPRYAFYALAGTPSRPGLVRLADADRGGAIELEVWSLPAAALGDFVRGIPSPLGLGRVQLDGGGDVLGFLCEAAATEGARDITAHGGWRAFLAAVAA